MEKNDENYEDECQEDFIAKLRNTFKDEAYELLVELEAALLDLEKAPGDPELVGRIFRAMHTIKGSGAACGLIDISSFTHELETFFDLVRKGKIIVTIPIIELSLSARDHIKALFDACYGGGTIDEENGRRISASFKKLISAAGSGEPEPSSPAASNGENAEEQGVIESEDAHQKPASRKRFETLLAEMGLSASENGEAETAEQRRRNDSSSRIRVASERLDSLVNLVGQLVTVQARLTQTAVQSGTPELLSIAEEVERLTASLRENAMNIRMMPIGTTFSKFRRMVRDLSQELGKEIELVTEGAETELDKTVIERLSEPLMHLIRNSIDHGIEPREIRAAEGKPRSGTVRLSARHSGACVLIQVSDDGGGLDREAIRARAVELGRLLPGETPDDRQLFSLIFSPGFSTVKAVTDISGRGVGMDVVKDVIDSLRGSIELMSRKGEGTTITLKLPLTLAIIDGFLTRVGAEHYIFPLTLVDECVELTAEQTVEGNGRNLINVRDGLVPFVRLRDQFQTIGRPPAIEQVVITRVEDKRIGFVVDHAIGGHQTVIKNLGTFYRGVEGISGATILGDGTVALVLDVPRMAKLVEQEETAAVRK